MSVSPPRPKMPPLNALRAFEAAARLGSIAAAAEELSVTPGAVSQQVRQLEGWAGRALFQRQAQGVTLTQAGAAVLPALSAGFDGLGQAARQLSDLRPDTRLSIAALPAIAQLWLGPRLGEIRAAFPALTPSIYALELPPNPARALFDLSLFLLRPEEAPGAMQLSPDLIAPVCAPEIAARLSSPADLMGETLLLDESWSADWTRWAEATGTALPELASAPRYSLYSLMVEDAKAGAGVMMGHGFLVAEALEKGTLVRPFALEVATGKALMLMAQTGRAKPLANRLKLLS